MGETYLIWLKYDIILHYYEVVYIIDHRRSFCQGFTCYYACVQSMRHRSLMPHWMTAVENYLNLFYSTIINCINTKEKCKK